MTLPLIGIIPSRKFDPAGNNTIFINEAYVQAVSAAGGAPFVIPLGLPLAALEALLPTLDGVLFSGGGDVHPERYGSSMHPKVDYVDADRDRVELYLLPEVIRHQMPFFGICRGFQVINVALGGTLYEDVLDQHRGAIDHRHQEGKPRNHLTHSVSVLPGSLLGSILGQETVMVNSLHHQGVRQLARSLHSTANAPDGLVEAFEMPEYPFGLAVQWHPECIQEHASMQRLFQAFIQASGDHGRS